MTGRDSYPMLRRLRVGLELWRRIFHLLRRSSPGLTIAGAVLTILEVIFGIGSLYLIKLLIDQMTTELSRPGGQAQPTTVFVYLGLVAAALLGAVAVQAVSGYARVAQGLKVSERIDREIHDRAISVDLSFYESPAYFDSLERARQAGTQRPSQLVISLLLLLKGAAFLVAVLIMIAGIRWWILPAFLFALIAVLGERLRYTRRQFAWQIERTQLERWASYLDWLITSHHHAKEVRIGNLGAHLRDAYGKVRAKINARQIAIEREKAIGELVVSAVAAAVFAGATVLLVLETLAGRQTTGNVVLFVLLFRRAEVSGREFVQQAAKLYDDQLYLRQLFDFLSVDSRIRAPERPKPVAAALVDGVRFHGVTFRYPDAAEPTLSEIELTLPSGKVVALVGANGSGKTTLIKLLTRLYDPNEGRITLEGTDIREFDPAKYRRLFSVVFQDYARYAATVRENIRYGDIERPPNDSGIEAAAIRAGAAGFVSGLPRGFDTPLSRMFDGGQEISLGQWQRLALARAFFPDSRFVVMDEPSSALDPQAEFDLFENFREALGSRGGLIISHRLSTVCLADYTYVLDAGRIVEHGTHDELVRRGGRYAGLFELQGRRYKQ